LSSAILYVAIVAIWACVLIPRWLRRDPPAERERDEAQDEAPEQDAMEQQDTPREQDDDGERRAAPERRPASRPRSRPARGQEQARVLSARRRLLWMLLVLAAVSGTLAYTRLAAWWVVVPPSVMLLGYLPLLRAASRADAERRELERAAVAKAAKTARVAARRQAAARPAPRGAGVPDAEVIRISPSRGPRDVEEPTGRRAQGGTEPYDQYADAKLRAVGD
jgi:hypothetical protein